MVSSASLHLQHPAQSAESKRATSSAFDIQRSNLFAQCVAYLYSYLQKTLKIMPGEEFRAAYQEARKLGACVVLGDRPVPVTVARTWHALSLREKAMLPINFLLAICWMPSAEQLLENVEKMKDTDLMTEAFKEVGRWYPSLLRPLVEERDVLMVCSLRQCALMQRSHHSCVVAVVGAGHVPGIKVHWDRDVEEEEFLTANSHPPTQPPGRCRSLLAALWRFRATVLVALVAYVAFYAFLE